MIYKNVSDKDNDQLLSLMEYLLWIEWNIYVSVVSVQCYPRRLRLTLFGWNDLNEKQRELDKWLYNGR